MKYSVKTMMMTAAVSGLLGGTAARLEGSPLQANTDTSTKISASNAKAGKISLARATANDEASKHSCKGKNDCKGEGGCKAGDNGCKGKNSCKGKGGCATDGSKAPELAA